MEGIAGHTGEQACISAESKAGVESPVKGNMNGAKIFSQQLSSALVQAHAGGLLRHILKRLVQYLLQPFFCERSIHKPLPL